MNLLILQNPYEFFQFFYCFLNTVVEKNWSYDRGTRPVKFKRPGKILMCDMEFWYKNF